MQLKRGLGRGMESLIPPPVVETIGDSKDRPYRTVPIDSIIPNRLQPRTVFDEGKIRELADSIREQGIIQPLIVSPMEDGRYELIAGERRLRAARMAGLEDVPVIIKKVDDEGFLALSIIENIQREDLNPLEEARAFQELTQQFGYTQDEAAKKVGRSRSAVANSIRLLSLPRVIQEDVASGRYSAGHARAILAIEGLHDQLKFRERIIRDLPTVRDIEKMVQSYGSNAKKPPRRRPVLSPQMSELLEALKARLGTKVQFVPRGNGGKIIIDYYSAQDLDRIYRQVVS